MHDVLNAERLSSFASYQPPNNKTVSQPSQLKISILTYPNKIKSNEDIQIPSKAPLWLRYH